MTAMLRDCSTKLNYPGGRAWPQARTGGKAGVRGRQAPGKPPSRPQASRGGTALLPRAQAENHQGQKEAEATGTTRAGEDHQQPGPLQAPPGGGAGNK